MKEDRAFSLFCQFTSLPYRFSAQMSLEFLPCDFKCLFLSLIGAAEILECVSKYLDGISQNMQGLSHS